MRRSNEEYEPKKPVPVKRPVVPAPGTSRRFQQPDYAEQREHYPDADR